jgi:hypothetical protein
MSKYGKRPDLLIFKKDAFSLNLPQDISEKDEEIIKDIVFRSIAGIECRSSSYYYNDYIDYMREKGKESKELSITVKEEDIERLVKWRKTYCGSKPLYYLQLFFDKGFFISFDEILNLIKRAEVGKVEHYSFKKDRKTGKTTHFIGISHARVGLVAIEPPTVTAESIKGWDGKVYAIRTPQGGKFELTNEFIQELLTLV